MKDFFPRLRIGRRTYKTALAVMIAMFIVDAYGATTSKLIFAMLGAMEAVQPTFRDSLRACISQVAGVLLGALVGVVLMSLPINQVFAAGLGIVVMITLYNGLRLHLSPTLACLIVVTLCTTPGIVPGEYAVGRIWDSMIGLSVGMAVNTLIFPYDNSRQIRQTAQSLDRELIRFLETVFDGNETLPNVRTMSDKVNTMSKQLETFSNQKLLMHLTRQKQEIVIFEICEGKFRELLARMEVLSRMGTPGRLNAENRRRLEACGADIRDARPLNSVTERDVVTNYHIRQILTLRRELLEVLNR